MVLETLNSNLLVLKGGSVEVRTTDLEKSNAASRPLIVNFVITLFDDCIMPTSKPTAKWMLCRPRYYVTIVLSSNFEPMKAESSTHGGIRLPSAALDSSGQGGVRRFQDF